MRITIRMAVRTAVFSGVALWLAGMAQAGPLAFTTDAQGRVQPFRVRNVALGEVIDAYAKLEGYEIIEYEAPKGSASVWAPRSMARDQFRELILATVADSGYSLVANVEPLSFTLMRQRDARDDTIPIVDVQNVPDSYQLVSAFFHLKNIGSEHAARALRSFTPASSRIIPASDSVVIVTDVARNIRKCREILNYLDVPGAGARLERMQEREKAKRACGAREERIEKLIVENLRVENLEKSNLSVPQASPAHAPASGLTPPMPRSLPVRVGPRSGGAR